MNGYDRAPARLRAMGVADLLHRELRLDTSKAIDVFAIIEDLGMWLGFKKLTNLLGMYLTEGPGGVMLTTERDVSVQRYTAAHEIGHWALDSGELDALDDDLTVHGVNPSEREFLAQIFAAYFLMPPTAVYASMTKLSITARGIGPRDAYAVSRELGASYEATVRHLHSLDIVDVRRERELLEVSRLAAMTQLAHGMRPRDGRADVWMVDERWHQEHVEVNVNDQVVISLPERPSTGARWVSPGVVASRDRRAGRAPVALTGEGIGLLGSGQPIDAPSPRRKRKPPSVIIADLAKPFAEIARTDAPLQVTDTRFETTMASDDVQTIGLRLARADPSVPSPVPAVGGVGRRLLAVTALRPGEHVLELQYARPFGDEAALGGFALNATVVPRRYNFDRGQILGTAGRPIDHQRRVDDGPLDANP